MPTSSLHRIKFQKTGNRWGTQLITKLWIITEQHWTHTNDVLHETEVKENLSDIALLKEAISHEYDTGLNSLLFFYSSYFFLSLDTILSKSASYLKQWFLVIRSGREVTSLDLRFNNFYTEAYLRSWIGLKKI